MIVKIKLLPGATAPQRMTAGSSGADVYAFVENPIVIKPNHWKLIPTGLFLEIPVGYELQVRPRSGLAATHGVTVLNAPGTIDSDYRGELKVILINHGEKDFVVSNGMRIAQIVAAQACAVNFQVVDALLATQRGEDGFGSTGH